MTALPTIPKPRTCPDGGTCHHDCGSRCFRVDCCAPLSGTFPDDKWPAHVLATGPALTVTHEVPLSRIADLICCAVEGGVNRYWMRIERTRKPRKPVAYVSPQDGKIYPHIDYALCKGGAITFRDTEDATRPLMVLDLDAIKRGLALMPKLTPRHWADFLSENEDASTGDVFVQLCLLGEIVYG